MIEYKEFIEHVRLQKFTWAKLYTDRGLFAVFSDPVAGTQPTTQGLLGNFSKIQKSFGGQYKIDCKKHQSDNENLLCSFEVDFKDSQNDSAIKPDSVLNPNGQTIDIDVMSKEIQERIIEAQVIRERELEFERLKEENTYLKEPAGILTEVIRMVGKKVQEKGYNVSTRSGRLAGTTGATSTSKNETEPAAPANGPRYDLLESDEPKGNSKDLENALSNFKSVDVSDNFLLQLSERVKAKPELIETVGNLLNIKN